MTGPATLASLTSVQAAGVDLGAAYGELIDTLAAWLLRPGDIVLDIGAGSGRFTARFASHVAPGGRVHAFEPLTDLMDMNRNVAAKRHADAAIYFHPIALYDEAGKGVLHRDDERPSLSSLRPHRMASPTREVTIEMNTLDTLWPDGRADFIKLDAQGAEYRVLRGGTAFIERSAPFMILQNSGNAACQAFGYTADEFFNLFDRLGLALYDAFGSPLTPDAWRSREAGWYFCAFNRERMPERAYLSVVSKFWQARLQAARHGESGIPLGRQVRSASGFNLGEQYGVLIDTLADRLLRPGEIVLDIGAGEGRFTLPFASRIAPGGVVHAFEPRSDAVTKNRMAAEAHGLDSLIRYHNLALANFNGEAEFHRNDARPGFSTLHRHRPDEITRATTVPVATLDAVFPTEQAGFIKLDAQGGEFAVMSGGMAVIARSAPFIIFQNARIAASHAGGYGPDAFFALFDQLGLTLFDAFGSPFTPQAWRNPDAGWYFCAFHPMRLDPEEFQSMVTGFWREQLRERDEVSAVTAVSSPVLTRTTVAAAGVDLAAKYEALIDTLADRLMPRGACVIDAGANVGRHTIPFARRVGPSGRVHAFEPQDDIMERNRSAAGAAGVATIIRYHGHGLADVAGDAIFMRNDAHPGLSSLRQLHHPEVTRAITVRLERLDDVLPGECVDFIKLDIEGAEYAALRGGMNLIARTGPFIVMENGLWQTSRRYGYTREDFFGLFDDLGFEVFDAFGHRLTRSRWYSPGAGWYFCAFPRSRLDPTEYRAIVAQFWNNCMLQHSGSKSC